MQPIIPIINIKTAIIMNSNGQSTRKSQGSLRVRVENYCYNIHQKLGSGYSSQVFKGWDDKNSKTVAIKVINLHRVRERKQQNLLANQLKLLKELRHPNLVHYIEALMTVNNCYIITDFCSQGDLGFHIAKKGRMSIDQGAKVMFDLASSIDYLHKKQIIHRDIKPQNILLHEKRPQLADFGFAIKIDKILKDGYKVGTPLYMSPQTLFHKQYSKKSDVWSLGMTMYELFEGRPPWQIRDEKHLKEMIKEEIKFENLEHEEMKKIIQGCLTYEKEQRWSIQDVCQKLSQIAGVRKDQNWQVKDDKQNNENILNVNSSRQDSEEVKKQKRSNYAMLKWLINYSRFAAKLLPKIQSLRMSEEIKEPFIELTAKCLHMTITKLHRIDDMHGQLGLAQFAMFKRTSRFLKIQKVTQEYHHKYLLMLTKFSYSYSISASICLQIQEKLIDSLEKLQIENSESQKVLSAIQGILILIGTNLEAKNNSLSTLYQKINFEKLIENSSQEFSEEKVEELKLKQRMILDNFGRNSKEEENTSEDN